jgi:hypothetical protein
MVDLDQREAALPVQRSAFGKLELKSDGKPVIGNRDVDAETDDPVNMDPQDIDTARQRRDHGQCCITSLSLSLFLSVFRADFSVFT